MLAAALSAGCAPSNEAELRQWMAEVRQQARPVTQTVTPPKEFTPYSYESAASSTPSTRRR